MQEHGRGHRPLTHTQYFSRRAKRTLIGLGIATYIGILAFGCERDEPAGTLERTIEDSAYVQEAQTPEYCLRAAAAPRLNALYAPDRPGE